MGDNPVQAGRKDRCEPSSRVLEPFLVLEHSNRKHLDGCRDEEGERYQDKKSSD